MGGGVAESVGSTFVPHLDWQKRCGRGWQKQREAGTGKSLFRTQNRFRCEQVLTKRLKE